MSQYQVGFKGVILDADNDHIYCDGLEVMEAYFKGYCVWKKISGTLINKYFTKGLFYKNLINNTVFIENGKLITFIVARYQSYYTFSSGDIYKLQILPKENKLKIIDVYECPDDNHNNIPYLNSSLNITKISNSTYLFTRDDTEYKYTLDPRDNIVLVNNGHFKDPLEYDEMKKLVEPVKYPISNLIEKTYFESETYSEIVRFFNYTYNKFMSINLKKVSGFLIDKYPGFMYSNYQYSVEAEFNDDRVKGTKKLNVNFTNEYSSCHCNITLIYEIKACPQYIFSDGNNDDIHDLNDYHHYIGANVIDDTLFFGGVSRNMERAGVTRQFSEYLIKYDLFITNFSYVNNGTSYGLSDFSRLYLSPLIYEEYHIPSFISPHFYLDSQHVACTQNAINNFFYFIESEISNYRVSFTKNKDNKYYLDIGAEIETPEPKYTLDYIYAFTIDENKIARSKAIIVDSPMKFSNYICAEYKLCAICYKSVENGAETYLCVIDALTLDINLIELPKYQLNTFLDIYYYGDNIVCIDGNKIKVNIKTMSIVEETTYGFIPDKDIKATADGSGNYINKITIRQEPFLDSSPKYECFL